ncbi:hypothetical protein C5167_027956 [Papaver somniferum]|nr:hypothetical protein C5167_027956 [Papaver somniferum]
MLMRRRSIPRVIAIMMMIFLYNSNRQPSGRGRENKRLKISQGPIDVAINTEKAQSHTQGVYVETSFASLINVKVEKWEIGMASAHRNEPDKLDHMSLRERLKLLTAKKPSDSEDSRPSECLQKAMPPVENCKPTASENAKSEVKKTALEEDAPGLLQVLVEKGILLDEIKLYGGMECEDALDSSFDENSFEDLQGLRYLQFRMWPVEWGWCGDLQSFIFVFERHNRIVLERPEYGYATYFFELVNSLPVGWQIKRLVTTMKLNRCSRATIIENRAFLVGEDLSEGEARLKEYG